MRVTKVVKPDHGNRRLPYESVEGLRHPVSVEGLAVLSGEHHPAVDVGDAPRLALLLLKPAPRRP